MLRVLLPAFVAPAIHHVWGVSSLISSLYYSTLINLYHFHGRNSSLAEKLLYLVFLSALTHSRNLHTEQTLTTSLKQKRYYCNSHKIEKNKITFLKKFLYCIVRVWTEMIKWVLLCFYIYRVYLKKGCWFWVVLGLRSKNFNRPFLRDTL